MPIYKENQYFESTLTMGKPVSKTIAASCQYGAAYGLTYKKSMQYWMLIGKKE